MKKKEMLSVSMLLAGGALLLVGAFQINPFLGAGFAFWFVAHFIMD